MNEWIYLALLWPCNFSKLYPYLNHTAIAEPANPPLTVALSFSSLQPLLKGSLQVDSGAHSFLDAASKNMLSGSQRFSDFHAGILQQSKYIRKEFKGAKILESVHQSKGVPVKLTWCCIWWAIFRRNLFCWAFKLHSSYSSRTLEPLLKCHPSLAIAPLHLKLATILVWNVPGLILIIFYMLSGDLLLYYPFAITVLSSTLKWML